MTEDHVRKIQVSLAPGTGTPPPRPGQTLRDLSQSLDWIRVHAGSGTHIDPKRLLNTCMHLARTPSAGSTAFQCADGLHTGATFAAANTLFRHHLRAPIVGAAAWESAVLATCLAVRRDRGPELFRPVDLASLMAFGRLVQEADRQGELREIPMPPASTDRISSTAPMQRMVWMMSMAPPTSGPARARETAPPLTVTRTFDAAPEIRLRDEPPRSQGRTASHVRFAHDISVRYEWDVAEGDGSEERHSHPRQDFRRTIFEGNLPVPRRIGRTESGEDAEFPDPGGHDANWRQHRNPRKASGR